MSADGDSLEVSHDWAGLVMETEYNYEGDGLTRKIVSWPEHVLRDTTAVNERFGSPLPHLEAPAKPEGTGNMWFNEMEGLTNTWDETVREDGTEIGRNTWSGQVSPEDVPELAREKFLSGDAAKSTTGQMTLDLTHRRLLEYQDNVMFRYRHEVLYGDVPRDTVKLSTESVRFRWSYDQ
jgi:hypothetical protein